eukprot:5332392-Amphidinium_carterae.1
MALQESQALESPFVVLLCSNSVNQASIQHASGNNPCLPPCIGRWPRDADQRSAIPHDKVSLRSSLEMLKPA